MSQPLIRCAASSPEPAPFPSPQIQPSPGIPCSLPGDLLPPVRDVLAVLSARGASGGGPVCCESAEVVGDAVLDWLAAAFVFAWLP